MTRGAGPTMVFFLTAAGCSIRLWTACHNPSCKGCAVAISLFKSAVRSYKTAMAASGDQTGAEEAAGRQFVRQFDVERAGALAQFREILPQKAQAGKLLQQLNKRDRHDIVLALTDDVSMDSKTA